MYLLLNFKIFPIKLIHFIYLFVCSASFYSLIRNKVFRFFDLFGNICDRLSIVIICRYGFLAIQLFFFQNFNRKQFYKFFDRSLEEFLSTSIRGHQGAQGAQHPPLKTQNRAPPPPKRSAHPSRVRRECFDPPLQKLKPQGAQTPTPLKKF